MHTHIYIFYKFIYNFSLRVSKILHGAALYRKLLAIHVKFLFNWLYFHLLSLVILCLQQLVWPLWCPQHTEGRTEVIYCYGSFPKA